MNFNEHSHLKGEHAFLSPSKYHWVNYDDEKLTETYKRQRAQQLGIRLHEFAAECILLGIKLPRSKKTLNMFVNDAIGYRMNIEQVLYYSDNAFGTTDAISFRNNILRIHDLKTGITPASMRQLEVYTSLFCLEYGIQPEEVEIELRIYQNDEIIIYNPTLEDIHFIMERIIYFDKQIELLKKEG